MVIKADSRGFISCVKVWIEGGKGGNDRGLMGEGRG
jgi:hypothetical protein